MSQFDFPRINFHGKALLDTATANNGNYEPSLTMFDQDNSVPFMPPRCYLPQGYTYVPPPSVEIINNSYVPIKVINEDNYQQWATTPLGNFEADKAYWSLYNYLTIPNGQPLAGNNPGYWNYYGDLSVSLVNTQVTGITLPDAVKGAITHTPQNHVDCPAELASLFDAVLSFNNDYFAEGSRTSANFCDADSIGQMCTQLFCGQAGLYSTDAQGNQVTFFTGTPVKSTARWMNLNKILNYADPSIIPMGGSACFYAMIALSEGSILSETMAKFTGKPTTGLLLKMLIHEVHEVRAPDYANMTTQNIYDIFGNQSGVKKNPATASVSGSITPWFEGDLTTASISRLMQNSSPVTINTANIPPPQTKSGNKLLVAGSVNLAAIQFSYDDIFKLLSLDLINTINEYGINPGALASYAGNSDIPPFQNFLTYNYGTFTVMFQPDNKTPPQTIGSFDYDNDYNMQQLLASGGMVDIKPPSNIDFTKGYFYLTLQGQTVFTENNYLVISDQMGNYAQQNQTDFNYMSDGLPLKPCLLNVYYRGTPVSLSNAIPVTMQAIDLRTGAINNTSMNVYNGLPLQLPATTDGCMTYALIDTQSNILAGNMANLFQFVMNTSLIVVRTLKNDSALDPYLNGTTPITWDVINQQVFSLFKVLYPVMDAIIPFTQANWSSPFILQKMLVLIKDANWNQPMYMPVTRDLSANQIQLLVMWANQVINENQTT